MGTADSRRRVAAALRSRFETTTGGDEGLAAAVAALARDEAIGPIEDEIVAESLRVRGRASRDPLGLVLTPAPLAARLVGLCTFAFPDETASATTAWLDPCCGTGRLLAAAPGQARIGWDVDPVALAVAKALGRAAVERVDGLATRRPRADRLGVLCNPPFVPGYSRRSAARALDTPQLVSLSRGWARGRINVATAFVARVIRDLLRPGELAAFVLPTPLLTAPRHAPLRHALLRATDRCVVAHLADQRFAGRAVATSFLVCRVAPPRPALDVASSDAPLAELRYAELRDDAWTWMTVQGHDRPDADRGFAPATAASALTTALAAAGHRLGHTFRVADGANPGPAVARAALLSDQPSRLSAPRAAVEGRDVLPGRVRPARRWLDTDAARIDPAWRQAGTSLRDPELFVGPRLYSRQTTDRLVVGVVRDDSIALNSVHVIAPLDPHRRGALASIEALCGVLNTPAVASLYRATAPLESAAFPQIRVALLRELPLPWPPPKSIAAAARAWVAQPTDAALAHLDVLVRDWLATTAGKSAGRAG